MKTLEEIQKKLAESKPLLAEKYHVSELGLFPHFSQKVGSQSLKALCSKRLTLLK